MSGQKMMRNALMLFLITFVLSCVTLGLPSVPRLSERTLRLSEVPGVAKYTFLMCVKEWLGVCVKTSMFTEKYVLTDLHTWAELKTMGFALRVDSGPGGH